MMKSMLSKEERPTTSKTAARAMAPTVYRLRIGLRQMLRTDSLTSSGGRRPRPKTRSMKGTEPLARGTSGDGRIAGAGSMRLAVQAGTAAAINATPRLITTPTTIGMS
jgi:hypothetical protein